jgi:spoIIIJ-associated protein
MDPIEIEAKTVDEAISIACEQLKTPQENLTIEVLQDAPSKIFAFMSNRKAKIRATLISKVRATVIPKAQERSAGKSEISSDIESRLKETLETIVQYINASATVAVQRDESGIVFNIMGDGSGLFIGKQGQTLDALQFILNKIKGRYADDALPVTVDSEAYRSRRTESLVSLARQLGDKAKKRKGPVTTNLLNPAERRIIHLALEKDADLTTWSKGEGVLKKVIIAPKQSAK